MENTLIANIIRIIDTCAERGSFKGPEFTAVGDVRNQLVALLEAPAIAAEPEVVTVD